MPRHARKPHRQLEDWQRPITPSDTVLTGLGKLLGWNEAVASTRLDHDERAQTFSVETRPATPGVSDWHKDEP
jgi:hypothetical protein